MRILYSPRSDPMIVDTLSGLNRLAERLSVFLASDQKVLRLEVPVSGSPAPYDEFLPRLLIEKTNGPVLVALEADRTLSMRGAAENLSIYARSFHFREDEIGAHHHPHVDQIAPGTLSIIVEADEYYEADLTSEN
jgi:hypothetical protein